MVTQGLLVRLDARHDRHNDVEEFLVSARKLVAREPATSAWFAVRFGRGEYGIVDFFPNAQGREAHLAGPVAAALQGEGRVLLAKDPAIRQLDVLASKLPGSPAALPPVTRGLLLTFRARQGHEQQVENFLRNAERLVQDEPGTLAWFALRLDDGHYGIFDVFPDNGARMSHLTGHVPRELTKHAMSLLGGVPDMDMLQVLAANFAERETAVGLGVD